jgi:uncharacterized NAD-dependent epimerase/dehydratase family protein
VALNTHGLDHELAWMAVLAAKHVTGLPATDPVRFGAGPLAEAVWAHLGARRRHATAS